MRKSKMICTLLAGMIMLSSLCACSSAKDNKNNDDNGKPAADTNIEEGNTGSAEAKDAGVKVSSSDGYIIFKVDPSFHVTSASWMGICPAGRNYKNEGEADEEDLIWFSPEPFEEGQKDPFEFRIFEEDINAIEDGEYTMVLCEDDGVESSKCFLCFPVTVKGSKLSADLSRIVVN